MIITRSPYRISLFGGGSDYTDYILKNGSGLCIGFAIDKYSYITVRDLPPFFPHKTRLSYSKIECVEDNKDIEHLGIRDALGYMDLMDKSLEITHNSDLPTKTGLGTSSAFMVALTEALYQYKDLSRLSKLILSVTASNIEQINSYVGIQDHLFSAFGGFREFSFLRQGPGFKIYHYPSYNQKYFSVMEQNGLLFFTGYQRNASDILSTYIKDMPDNDAQKEIEEIASEVSFKLQRGEADICYLGEKLDWTWYLKKKISPNITTTKIDEIYDEAIKAGAIGGKLLGAGGGGTMFFLAEKQDHSKIIEVCQNLGCIHIPFKICNEGCKRIL